MSDDPACGDCGSLGERSACPLCDRVLCDSCAEAPYEFCCDERRDQDVESNQDKTIGWRVPPGGRSAHHLTLAFGYRDKFYSACNRVMFLGYVDDKPDAKHCTSCEKAIVTTPTEPRGHRICRCGACGFTARCAPDEDFYARDGENFLRCERCVCTDRMPATPPTDTAQPREER